MVQYCCAFNCRSQKTKGSKISFYSSFPHKNPELLKKWVAAVRRLNWYPTKHSKLCEKHFTPDSYQIRPNANVKLLRTNAVPTVFSYQKCLKTENDKEERTAVKRKESTESYSDDNPEKVMRISLDHQYAACLLSSNCQSASYSTLNQAPLNNQELLPDIPQNSCDEDSRTTNSCDEDSRTANSCDEDSRAVNLCDEGSLVSNACHSFEIPPIIMNRRSLKVPSVSTDPLGTAPNSPTMRELQRKLKVLRERLRRRDNKIQNLMQLIDELQDKVTCKDASVIIRENFSGTVYELFENELRNRNCGTNGQRYSEKVKEFALSLYLYSPKAYEYVQTILHLPAVSSVQRWATSGFVCNEPSFTLKENVPTSDEETL